MLKTLAKTSTRAAVTSLVLLLHAGCAGTAAFHEGSALLAHGQAEKGLAKLEEAVQADPRNAEFRIALAGQRLRTVERLIASAEASLREGRFDEAESAYKRVLQIDQANARAQQGLQAVAVQQRHRKTLEEVRRELSKGDSSEAADLGLDRVRTILEEDPANKAALTLKAEAEDMKARTSRNDARLASVFRKPITLEFRETPLRSVLDFISQVSGLNFFFDKEVRTDVPVTLVARGTSIESALRVVLTTNQLERTVLDENSLLIFPATPQKLKEYQALSVRTFYIVNSDVKAVATTLKSIAKVRDVVVDERVGLVIVRDTPEVIRVAERLVALQDQSDPEVMLELEVLEVQRSRLVELGVNWPDQVTLAPLQVNGLTLRALRNLDAGSIAVSPGTVAINANGQDQDSNVLANPRIRVRNKEKAKVLIGDRVPVVTSTSTSTGFVSESVSYLDVGLKLEVEPSVYLDEEVAIKVNLEVSNLIKEITTKSGALSYQIGTRGANTVLRLKNGETQVLAGLINDEERTSSNKIPILGDLPLIRRVFASQKDDNQRTEILLSITPRIVRGLKRAGLSTAEFESGTENSVGAVPLRLVPAPDPARKFDSQPQPATGEQRPQSPAMGVMSK